MTSQRAFPEGIFYSPLINSHNEIVIALKDSVAIVDRELASLWEQNLCSPRTLAFTERGHLLVGCNDGVTAVDEARHCTNLALSQEFKKGSLTPFVYMVEGPEEKLYTLTGDAVFCFDRELTVLWSLNLASRFGLFGGWRMALHPRGMVFAAGAFSWQDEDGYSEYAAYLCAISPEGEMLWQKNHEIDELPTSSGLSLRLTVTPDNVWLSDCGAVCFTMDGNETWRSGDEEGTTQLFTMFREDEIIFAQNKELYALTARNRFIPARLFAPHGWPHEICCDRDNNLYVLGTEGLEAWSPEGTLLFEIKGLIGERIALGEGFIVVSSRRGKITIIE